MDTCSTCGSDKDLYIASTYKLKNGTIKHSYRCRLCNTERMRLYRKTPNGYAAIKRAVKKYESTHKDRRRAWVMAHYYNKKQKPCVICGKLPTHMHHPDINKLRQIIFLCPIHHRQADRQR